MPTPDLPEVVHRFFVEPNDDGKFEVRDRSQSERVVCECRTRMMAKYLRQLLENYPHQFNEVVALEAEAEVKDAS